MRKAMMIGCGVHRARKTRARIFPASKDRRNGQGEDQWRRWTVKERKLKNRSSSQEERK